ncbi:hypothetical protein AALO_G00280030 [Alosa alosa]|uniref:Uncharacterized protein n=1 Tax=Alosa alosa TaxID=278164 RepID=A0AAV6FP76_9TELE|nr:hypothetical protein AALO_G00280030 [Alosa alosa]
MDLASGTPAAWASRRAGGWPPAHAQIPPAGAEAPDPPRPELLAARLGRCRRLRRRLPLPPPARGPLPPRPRRSCHRRRTPPTPWWRTSHADLLCRCRARRGSPGLTAARPAPRLLSLHSSPYKGSLRLGLEGPPPRGKVAFSQHLSRDGGSTAARSSIKRGFHFVF